MFLAVRHSFPLCGSASEDDICHMTSMDPGYEAKVSLFQEVNNIMNLGLGQVS